MRGGLGRVREQWGKEASKTYVIDPWQTQPLELMELRARLRREEEDPQWVSPTQEIRRSVSVSSSIANRGCHRATNRRRRLATHSGRTPAPIAMSQPRKPSQRLAVYSALMLSLALASILGAAALWLLLPWDLSPVLSRP